MCSETWHLLVFPVIFFGVMILCMFFSRRKGGRFCGSSFVDRFSHEERIRRMEEELRRLKSR